MSMDDHVAHTHTYTYTYTYTFVHASLIPTAHPSPPLVPWSSTHRSTHHPIATSPLARITAIMHTHTLFVALLATAVSAQKMILAVKPTLNAPAGVTLDYVREGGREGRRGGMP